MLTRHGLAACALSVLLLLAGCSVPFADSGFGDDDAPPAPAGPSGDVATPDENFSDPDGDPLGWEDGYWYNESVDVDQSDGLSDDELRTYVARSMARVEYLRHAEFEERVSVETLSREEYRAQSAGDNGTATTSEFDNWNNQVWEAMFVTGESNDSQEAIGETRGSSVAGFYDPNTDEIKVITDSPDSPTINNVTLVHELTHALQDQQYNLSSDRFRGETQDGDLAIDGAVEGDARYVEMRYTDMCDAEWSCVPTPSSEGGSGDGDLPNFGIYLTIYQPYSDGPPYVYDAIQEGGWDAVDDLLSDPPESTEQTIHHTDEEPVPINYRDRATNGWSTFSEQGENGSDTLGEASMYVMFWYQARSTGADTVSQRSVGQTNDPYDTFNYDAEPSAGWGNDRLFPYRKSTADGTDYGYVWTTEWDTEEDAREFRTAYLNILSAHDAVERGPDTWVIESGEFADAFRVTRNGTTVTVVNGPTTEDVNDIRPREN